MRGDCLYTQIPLVQTRLILDQLEEVQALSHVIERGIKLLNTLTLLWHVISLFKLNPPRNAADLRVEVSLQLELVPNTASY